MIFILFALQILYFLLSAHACPRGSFRTPGSSECALCGPGTYQPAMNSTRCVPCAPGNYHTIHGAQSPHVCNSCPAGTFSSAGSSSCTPCPEGSSSARASDRCVRCPKGTVILPWYDRFNNESCETCSYGYTDEDNLLECKRCPHGTWAPPGSTSVNQCKRCPPGTTSNGYDQCVGCGFGRIFSQEFSECVSCPLGSKSKQLDDVGNCVLCESGQYGEGNQYELPDCHRCPENTTTYASGARFCRRLDGPCPKGFLQTSSGDCVRCNADERYDMELERCVPCPDNHGSVGGLPLQCAHCTEVVKARIKNSKCALSEQFVLPDENHTCPPGNRIEETKFGKLCDHCFPGNFSDHPNATECLPCPSGTVSKDYDAKKCVKCPNGSVPDRSRTQCIDPLTYCAVGTYLHVAIYGDEVYPSCVRDECSVSKVGLRSCPPCTGSFGETFSFAGCSPCSGNLVRNFDFVCVCHGTTAQNLGIVNGSCSECPVGSYGTMKTGEMDHECVQCPAGTYRVVSTLEELQKSRLPGRIRRKPCQKCPAGFVTRHDGATDCEKCPDGTFSYGIGETECLAFGAASEPVSFNDALDQNVKRELARLSEWF